MTLLRKLAQIGQREPAILLALLTTSLALAAAFGLELSKEQSTGIMAFAVAVGALLTRMLVTPNVSVAAKANPPEQAVAGPAATVFEGTPVDVVPVDVERGEVGLGYLATCVLIAVLVIVVVYALF